MGQLTFPQVGGALLTIIAAVIAISGPTGASGDLLPTNDISAQENRGEGNDSEFSSGILLHSLAKRSLKDVDIELEAAEGRHKNRHTAYNHKSKPRRNHYNNHNRHSDHKKTKGGYHASDSYNSNSGYSTNSNFDRARKGDFGDSDHKEYGGRSGNSYGGKGQGGREYGGRSGGSGGYHGGSDGQYRGGSRHHHGGYGDDSNSYLDTDHY